MTSLDTRKSLFTILLILALSSITFGQRLKRDTVFYDRAGELVSAQSDYLTYEVRNLDRKKRIQGITARYTKSGRITESTTYDKGEKTGTYYRHNPAGNVMMYGDYVNGIKTGFWVTLDINGSILTMEEYADGTMIGKRNSPYVMDDQGKILDIDMKAKETEATFVGGSNGWGLHLRQNLKYPQEAKKGGYQGAVDLSCVILSDGRVVAARAISSPHEILSIESLRVLNLSPPWNPATVKGKPVDSQRVVRILFRLK